MAIWSYEIKSSCAVTEYISILIYILKCSSIMFYGPIAFYIMIFVSIFNAVLFFLFYFWMLQI